MAEGNWDMSLAITTPDDYEIEVTASGSTVPEAWRDLATGLRDAVKADASMVYWVRFIARACQSLGVECYREETEMARAEDD